MASPESNLLRRWYSIDELLAMRSSLSVVDSAVQMLNEHPDIATILRVPEDAATDPENLANKSRTLADVTNGRRVLHLNKNPNELRTIYDNDQQDPLGGDSISHSHTVQWHLRRRNSSSNSSQPYCAPSDLAAQQSENFQRFYRAVVSPTHVRVTAGGRIVPNTRTAAPPPAFGWNPDNLLLEPRKPLLGSELNTETSRLLQIPNQSAGFELSTTNTLVNPYKFSTQGNSLALAGMAAQTLRDFVGNDTRPLDCGQASNFLSDSTTAISAPGTLPQHIKISPPSQFDQSRPFLYNGQVVFPVPAGYQPLPSIIPTSITMLGNPHFVPQHSALSTNTFLPPQLYNPAGLMNPSMMPGIGQQLLPMPMQNMIPSIENISASTSAPASPTMAAICELTKFQIEGLRGHLRYIENQLANNRHQIDETYMEFQRETLRVHIEKMESLLEAQLTHASLENIEIVGRELNDRYASSATRQEEKKSLASDGQHLGASVGQYASQGSTAYAAARQITKPEDVLGVESLGSAGTSSRSDPGTKSRLTASAAMAPPFQPRALALAPPPPQAHTANALGNFGLNFQAQSGLLRTLATGEALALSSPLVDGDQTSPRGVGSGTGHASLSRAHTTIGSSLQNQFEVHPISLQRSSTLNGNSTTVASSTTGPVKPTQAIPYLVGVLPQGIQASEATCTDLIYSRPLTDEEVRARYLYWGKAPRSVQSGLPKFDGKDFYPPSPVRAGARLAVNSPVDSSNPNRNSAPVLLPDFEKLFTEPGVPGYKSPVRHSTSLQKPVPTSTQLFLENGVLGYRSPSPRPSAYRYEASAYPEWSSNFHPAGEHGYSLTNPQNVAKTTDTVTPDDFSHLFLERGVPGYKSPSPNRSDANKSKVRADISAGKTPVTPPKSDHWIEEKEGEIDDRESLDSWGVPKSDIPWIPVGSEIETSKNPIRNASLTATANRLSPDRAYCSGSADRAANLNSTEQQTLFLHNMLRNASNTSMAAPALSGTVSSATAQGYLPHYRGSAVASLNPARPHKTGPENMNEDSTAKNDMTNATGTRIAPLVAANFLPENRPLNRDRPQRPIRPSPETMGAEGYMRYLAQKAEDDMKIIEQGWNSKTTGTGPIMSSDW